jgi:hypothetical protein
MQIPETNEVQALQGTPLGLLSLGSEAWKWPDNVLEALNQQQDMNIFVTEGAKFMAKNIQSQMQARYRTIINPKRGAAERQIKVFCTPTVFKRAIWAGLFEREKMCKPKRRRQTYRANLTSMERLASLLGKGTLCRVNADKSKVFVAPKAMAMADWYDSEQGTELTPALQLRQGDYVAVLLEIRNHDLCLCWKAQDYGSDTVEILGQQVQGKVGLCPFSLLRFTSPTTIYYSPRSMMLSITISYFPFTAYGVYCNTSRCVIK